MCAALLAQAVVAAVPAGCTPSAPPSPDAASAGQEANTTGDDTTVFGGTTHPVSDEVVRIKGPTLTATLGPRLGVHRKAAQGIQRLHNGDTAQQDDVIQISYVSAGTRHGVILSLDGGGVVTLHYPNHPSASCGLIARGEQPLADAYKLDDAADFERFIFVTSPSENLNAGAVLDAARAVARGPSPRYQPLGLPGDWQQHSLTLNKVQAQP